MRPATVVINGPVEEVARLLAERSPAIVIATDAADERLARLNPDCEFKVTRDARIGAVHRDLQEARKGLCGKCHGRGKVYIGGECLGWHQDCGDCDGSGRAKDSE